MVLSLAAVLAAVAHAGPAAPVMPSFETLLLDARTAVHATRAEQKAVKDAALGQRIDRAAWDVQRWQRDASTLKCNLQSLKWRLNRHRQPQRGQPDPDPGLRWEVQRTGRDLEQHARDLQWTLQDLRSIRQAMTDKDPDLAGPVARLDSAVTWLSNDQRWLANDLRFFGFDLRRAGFHFEAFDYERAGRDIEDRGRGIEDETRLIKSKL